MRLAFWRSDKVKAVVQRAVPKRTAPAVTYKPAAAPAAIDAGDLDLRALGQALARYSGGDVIYDWGGGLIWAALPPKPDAQAALVRQRVGAAGGHASLIRASEETRRNIDVFHPQAAGIAALSQRVRNSFDPKIILNRGRMLLMTAT